LPDYRKMYLRMVHASEDAIRLLIKAQQECEELFIHASGDEEERNEEVQSD